jgi:D-alanyl-lipoteichoic acid acyltransferase DltB (MBOAT superfamily)
MLFNSYIFIFAFLPVALAGFHMLGRLGRRAAAGWLILISIFFYGWWNPQFVILLAASIAFNYAAAEAIGATEDRPALQAACLTVAVAANLSALFYYKYLACVIHAATGLGLLHSATPSIVLPLGISFFTFTQIGYLVDKKQGVTKGRGLLNYVLFVTFFPHLIAGPILHNREMMPQFGDAATYRFSGENFSVGLSVFAIGLAKKCLLADPLSATVTAGFGNAPHLPFLGAWNVALCYALQLYFDFSGYSDMAIGLARMFNVRFPLNFNSPYKATSIIEHWQRWHMTLTRYLNLYLYNPIALAVTNWRAERGLGIAKSAQAKPGGFAFMVMLPTLVTMGLAGVWHGAGLQFLIFGLLHGTYLTINHAFRIFRARRSGTGSDSSLVHISKLLLTHLAVIVSLIFFRAPSVGAAMNVLGGMVGLHGAVGLELPNFVLSQLGTLGDALTSHAIVTGVTQGFFAADAGQVIWIVCLYGAVWCLPNTQQIMRGFAPALGRVQPGPFERLAWQPTAGWALAVGVLASVGVLAISGTTEFLYFQF